MRKVKSLTVSIPADLVDKLDSSSTDLRVSRSALITMLVSAYYSNAKEDTPYAVSGRIAGR